MSKKVVRMVCGFAFNEQDRGVDQCVVLIFKNRGPASVRNRLNGVGGRVEEGETPVQAMVREFVEEAGCVTQEEEWGVPFVRLYGDGWEVSFFRRFGSVDRVQAGVSSLTDEPIFVMPVSVLLHRLDVVPNVRWLVPLALDPCIDPTITIDVHDVVPQVYREPEAAPAT